MYGNISRNSGSGVFFTHNPRWAGDQLALWGDFTIGNQGEDVVAGLVNTFPITIVQQDIEMRETDITLESHFPEIYQRLNAIAHELIDIKGWGPQEIEFTFETPYAADLYVLQTRDMVIRQRQKAPAFNLEGRDRRDILSHGIGVSGGAMSGRLVFTLEDIEKWRHAEPDTYLILARNDTVPDDIQEIHAADGLLTARGGLTSHATVVAHRLGKTCVVGCGGMRCDEKRKACVINNVVLDTDQFISIDGREGSIYAGKLDIQSMVETDQRILQAAAE